MVEEGHHQYAFSKELERLGERSVALGVLDLLFSAPEWVHRRVEQVQWQTASHYVRRVSIDFTAPNPELTRVRWFGPERTYLLPVDVLAKRPLASFSIRLADGLVLPTLTRRQNGHLLFAGISAYADDLLTRHGREGTSIARLELIRRIVQEPEESALEALQVLDDASGTDGDVGILLRDDGFMAALEMLARNFVLIAMAPSSPGRREVLKYSYEQSFDDPVDRRSRGERFAESFGWTPTTVEFEAPAFMDCETFHFEVSAPDGIELIDIVLGDEHASRRIDGEVAPEWALGYSRVLEGSPHRAHLSTSRTADPTARPDEFMVPRVSVRLRVERGSWLRSSALAATFVFAVLLASLPFVEHMDDRRSTDCVAAVSAAPGVASSQDTCGETQLNADPAAFSIALLSVISLAVIRVGEHAYTARMLRRLRVVALASAVLPIAAAWLLVFPGPGRTLVLGWRLLAVVGAVLAVLLVAVWRREA